MNKLGYNIRRLRKGLKLTQVELASLANVSSQVVSNWERGYTSLSSDDLTRLKEIFDVPADMILGNLNPPTNEINPKLETVADTKRKKGKELLETIKEERLDNTLFLLEQLNKE